MQTRGLDKKKIELGLIITNPKMIDPQPHQHWQCKTIINTEKQNTTDKKEKTEKKIVVHESLFSLQ